MGSEAGSSLEGKVAVVTGGASGIGLATATRLAALGASVAVVDRHAEAASAVAAELDGLGVAADVSRAESWPGIVSAVTGRFGGIDLAHLNAGMTTGEADITRIDDDRYQRATGVNVDGVFFGVRALVPVLSARDGGAIVATASLAGLIGFSPDPLYCMTKHAVVGLVRSLAPQLSQVGITVNAVCPSIVDTPLIADMRELLVQSEFPLIDADTVAGAVVDLMTGEATGEAVVIQAGREPLPFRFNRPPGPRTAGAEGRMPPAEFSAHDQGR
jgi:NAD(P)-dependent dehydrogenase (short-subunit alcohol dehydrogenase family)